MKLTQIIKKKFYPDIRVHKDNDYRAVVLHPLGRAIGSSKLVGVIYVQSYTPLFSIFWHGRSFIPNTLPYDLTNLNPSLPIGVPPLLNVATSRPKVSVSEFAQRSPSSNTSTYHQLPPKPSQLQIPILPTQAMLFV